MTQRYNFYQFLEARYSKSDESTKPIKALVDMAEALARVFKKYTRSTRRKAWKQLTSPKGLHEMEQIVRTPTRPLSRFRTLWSG